MKRSLLVAFALGLVGAACANPPQATVQLGSGVRFVPEVTDSIDDAGAWASAAVTSDGQPYVAYFGFPETLPQGQTANPRPIGLPSVPGVLLATAHDGIWTRGAIAMAAPIQNVNVAFDPATDKIVGHLTKDDVTGLDLAIDAQDGLHAAWASSSGLYYQSGSGDPASTTPWTLDRVSSQPVTGLSLAIDDQGNPWIAGYIGGASPSSVMLWTSSGSGWTSEVVSSATTCTNCSTAVLPQSGGPAVAFGGGGHVWLTSKSGKRWQSQDVGPGGEGLSGSVDQAGNALLSYYSGSKVMLAAGTATGMHASPVASVGEGSGTAEGARTSIAVDGSGAVTVGWYDATSGSLAFGSGKPGEQITPIDVGDSTVGGRFPSVAVAPDGSRSYLAWYAPATGPAVGGVVPGDDLLLGTYGSVQGLGLAIQSPKPSPAISVGPSPSTTACTKVAGGSIDLVAKGLAFDLSCFEPEAGKAFTIAFNNQDSATQHNVAIYPSSTQLTSPLFRGDPVTGVNTSDYKVGPLDAGTYYFQCDFHPTTMNGQVLVK